MTPLRRYIFLDVFRGIVVLLMLEGHFVRLVLMPDIQLSSWFAAHEVLHGLTAPAFIFGAGFTFAIARDRKGALLHSFNTAVLKRMWRAILIVIIGYALHLPFYSLTKTLSEASPEQWERFLQFDVLQLIGFGLLFLRIAGLLVHREDRLLLLVASFTLLIALATPAVWSGASVRLMPFWLVTALTGAHGSLFPVFPYAAFLFAGVAASWGFLRSVRQRSVNLYMRRLFVAGFIMIPAGLLFDALPVRIYADVDFWYTSPAYFWIRLGMLFVFLPLVWFLFRRYTSTEQATGPAPGTATLLLTRLGVESLFVYIGHLLLLYGSVINADTNIRGLFASSLTTGESFFWCLFFVIFFAAAAYGWNYLKRFHAPLMRLVFWWIAFMWVGEFVVRPW